MLISLVHPSRQRVEPARRAWHEWKAQASGRHLIEHVLSVDEDDPAVGGYRHLAAEGKSQLIVGPNRTMVEAVNRGAAAASGDLIVSIADDFGCPKDWDLSLVEIVGDRREAAVLVNDGIDARILTLPILTCALYQRLGYIYHPSYISMFADDDLTAVASAFGVLIDARDQLLFPHRHASQQLSEADATHARQNSNPSWWHGWRTFERRRIDGFGPPRTDLAGRLAHARVDAYYFTRTAGSRVRRAALPLVPASLRRGEARLHRAILRVVARLTSQKV